MHEVESGSRLGQGGQRGAQRFGLRAEAANPELAALIRRGRWRGWSGGLKRLPAEQTGYEEPRNRRQTRPQVRQHELRQQGHSALAGLTQVAAHADGAVEGCVGERARVEAVRGEWMFLLALRAVGRAMSIGVGKPLVVLLDRAGKWV